MNSSGMSQSSQSSQSRKFVHICQNDSPETSILIVVDEESKAKKIKEGVMHVFTLQKCPLKVHLCESIEQLLALDHPVHPDYVVFVLNLTCFQALKKVEGGLLKLSKAFLLDRTCLVVDTSQEGIHLHASDITCFKQKYQLHVLWGDIQLQCFELCERLFNLVTAVCGTFTGFPLITIPDRYVSIENRSN